jgi:acetylornithine deacetylase/succinyl-diaminopimelate desuccinylase-like protein
MRIAPGQDPATAQAALRDHLVAAAPWGAHVEVVDGLTGRPVSLGVSSRAAEVAQRCLRDAFGHEAVQIGVGGSIPFIAELAESYPDSAILVTGAGDPEASWHGPNENLHLGMFARTCVFEALLLHRLAQQG